MAAPLTMARLSHDPDCGAMRPRPHTEACLHACLSAPLALLVHFHIAKIVKAPWPEDAVIS